MTALLPRLTDLGHDDVDVAGAEAVTLGGLGRAGFPVAPGFVAGRPAFRALAADPLLERRIAVARQGSDAVAATARVRALLRAAPVPGPLWLAVLDAVHALGPDRPLTVRCPGTGGGAGVRGIDAVITALRACWARCITRRTLAPGTARLADDEALLPCVIVQRQVAARRTGEAWVPAGGRPTVDVAGDPVERFEVDRGRAAVAARPPRPSLRDDEVRTLAGLALEVDAHCGAPQRTTWAIDEDDRTWLLGVHARCPAGTGSRTPARMPADADAERWLEALARELGTRDTRLVLRALRELLAATP